MNYTETLEYLYTQLPMFTRIGGAAYKGSLHNTIALCNALGNPQHQFKSIHVAGTNGKGSTSHMLAAIFQTAGYKTGLYTSPHIHDFRERIKIDGQLCEEAFVVDFVAQIQPLIVALQPSFFEITVAMAFAYFAAQKVDIAIIEVGMGGRLDSTNVITPEACIITNIGFDHMQFLGNTLPEIAAEKAGIIKHKVPVVVGQLHPLTEPVFVQKAAALQAPIVFAETRYQATIFQNKIIHQQIQVVHQATQATNMYTLDVAGYYQCYNLPAVLCAIQLLQAQWQITQAHVQYALQHIKPLTGLFGRWEVLQQQPLLIADVAHNEDGIGRVVAQISDMHLQQVHIVIGMVKDKDIAKVLQLLPPQAQYYFTQAHIPRALPKEDLQHQAAEYGLQGDTYESVNDAIAAAKQAIRHPEHEGIFVCGSFFIVAEIGN